MYKISSRLRFKVNSISAILEPFPLFKVRNINQYFAPYPRKRSPLAEKSIFRVYIAFYPR